MKQISRPNFFEFNFLIILMKYLILRRRTYNYPLTLVSLGTLFMIVCIPVGFLVESRLPWMASLCWFLLSLYYYFGLKKVSDKLLIKRSFPIVARENKSVKITYIIENHSNFMIRGFSIEDEFDGCEEYNLKIRSPNRLRAHSRKNTYYQVMLDNGMGEKRFGHLKIHLWDPLGLYTFTIIYKFNQSMEVYPGVHNLLHHWDRAYDQNSFFGTFEFNKKGDSTNFTGIREYRNGDPLRYINWFLTQKTEKLMINEFDQMVNAQTTIVMNNLLKHHIGEGKNSTFEYIRDLALSISLDQLEKGNSLKLITTNNSGQNGRGMEFYHFLEKYILSMKLEDTQNRNFLLQREFPGEGSLIYLSPLHPYPELLEEMKKLARLSQDGVKVLIILIDSLSYFHRQSPAELSPLLAGLLASTLKRQEEIRKEIVKGSTSFFHTICVDGKDARAKFQQLIKEHQHFQEVYSDQK